MDNELAMATNNELLEELARRYATLVIFGHNEEETEANPTLSLVRGSRFTLYGGLAEMMYEARKQMRKDAGNDLDE